MGTRDTEHSELKPLLDDEPTRKSTGPTLREIAIAIDQLRTQFHDLAGEHSKIEERLDKLLDLVREHADGWIGLTTTVEQHERKIDHLMNRLAPDLRYRP